MAEPTEHPSAIEWLVVAVVISMMILAMCIVASTPLPN